MKNTATQKPFRPKDFNIELVNNNLSKFFIEKHKPENPDTYTIYFDSDSRQYMVFNGTTWQPIEKPFVYQLAFQKLPKKGDVLLFDGEKFNLVEG